MEPTFRPNLGSSANADTGFAQLFTAERLPMVRLATLLVGSVEVAEEVVQEAFSSVSQRWDRLDRPGGYLRTSVVNGCLTSLRRQSIEKRYQACRAETADNEIPIQLVELRSALDRLKERQRIVVVLRYFVDIPDEEIAQILGIKQATVRSLAHRAVTALRKELE